MTAKRSFLISACIVVLVPVSFIFLMSGGRLYRADSRVVATPLNKTLLSRSFETRVLGAIPAVIRLETTPTMSWATGSNPPSQPNAVEIRIFAVGLTAEDARRAAVDAAAKLNGTVLTNYGVNGWIVDAGGNARTYSFFYDRFQPAVGRIFKK
jgi:hypothetical protein